MTMTETYIGMLNVPELGVLVALNVDLVVWTFTTSVITASALSDGTASVCGLA